MCVLRSLPQFGLWGEMQGDYRSLGEEKAVWAQAGVAWQTVVAGVSLRGFKR